MKVSHEAAKRVTITSRKALYSFNGGEVVVLSHQPVERVHVTFKRRPR